MTNDLPEGTQKSKSSVTVVVASRDRPALLREALAAVERTLRPDDRLVVVDSASRDTHAIAEVVARTSGRLIRCDRPGLSRARNVGWRAAASELIAFTDDDCLPCEGWIEAFANAFDSCPSLRFVTGRVLPDSGSAGRAELALSVITSDETATFTADDDLSTMGHGANMAWRREVLEEVDGFDETLGHGGPLGAGGEDLDAFWRALEGGGVGTFDPSAAVVHRQWRGRTGQLRTYFGYGKGAGALLAKQWRSENLVGDSARKLGWRRLLPGVMKDLVWRHGVVGIGRNIAARYEMGILGELAILMGGFRGVLKTRGLPMEKGHLISQD